MRVNPAASWRAGARARPCPRRAPKRLRARRPGKKSGVTTPASAAPARSTRNVTTARHEEGRYLALCLGNTPTAGAFFVGRNGSPVLRNPMRLESVALHGFKSFAEKTVLKVTPGITAIVGPNGCGKSNISESVRWALGEQSAKSLRGQRMEDLIFHGSASRKPVGFAEAELTFSNDGVLSVPWTEVAVSRRLYRTGESEYFLNKNASRLRDILDLFAGTGANPRAYSVMDQEKLNHVLTAKPHERRVFIEEAAGIARYKQQRNETQGKLDAARQNLVRVRDVMDEVKRQLGSLERQARKAQQYKALQTEKRDLAMGMVASDYAALTAEGQRLGDELERLRDAEQSLQARIASLAAREARSREALQESEHRLSDLRQSVSKVQGELERLLERREQMGVQIRELGEETVRLDEEIGTIRERQSSIVGERDSAHVALRDAEQLVAERRQTAADLESTVERQRAALALERDHAEALRLEQTRLASERVDLMRSAGELRERAVMGDGESAGREGVVGTVADLLEGPPGMERAVEAVLGERLQWVVVERFEHARAAVAYLREHALGSATFLPLEYLPATFAPVPDDNGARWVTRSVTASAAGLVHHLLAQVAVVAHLDEAEALWRRNGVVATYVTPEGEVLGPTGRLHGGGAQAASAAEQSLLARKRQLRELEAEVGRLAAAVEAGQIGVTTLSSGLASLRERITGLRQSVQARLADRLAGQKDLERAVQEHDRVSRHVETIELESGQIARESEETGATLGRLTQRIAVARDAESVLDAAVARVREAIETAQASEAVRAAELTACRVDLASASERVEALGRELARLDEIERDLVGRLAQAEQRQTQLAERTTWLADERERTDVGARDVAAERDRIDAEARRANELHEGLASEVRAVEPEARGADSELAKMVAAAHEIDIRATECRVRPEELGQEAWRVYGVDTAALLASHDPARDLGPARERVAEIEERLVAIGPVNLVADDEYRELDERLTFLRAQHDDLTASIKDLDKALRGMTRTAQDRFAQAFDEINGHFGRLFERLFEGGRAELRLVEAQEGGDPLDTGVELMAQPRGKRLQAVTLLSGGERALTGLALLFAIFYFRPSPFCVLDEVDAPLDDANIYRFLRVLRELTGQTQFLVITHNRKTMEAADVLYGVTMEEPGLSTLVSVNLNAQ